MIGTRLSHFRITARLGAGGMGEVYRAHDERLGRDVAIKLLPPELTADETARARLRREARSLSRLNHPNICTVFDFDSDGDRTFIVVELLEGETLAERVARGPLEARDVRRIGGEIAAAVEAAHEEGVIHRDLKPGNVMITRRGATKVLDFGLARLEQVAGPAVSTESMITGSQVVGTLPYMAPEQIRGEAADRRTDVYGLGVTLYELATGRRPFQAAQPLALAAEILHQAPAPPRALGSKVDAGLEAVILRCLEKDPARRYQSASEVSKALAASGAASGAIRRLPATLRRHRRVPIVAGAILATALAGWLLRSGCGRAPSGIAERPAMALAVLPLVNLSGDRTQDFFADGMTEELITRLGQVAALRVTSRSSIMPYKGTSKTLKEIARDLHVSLLIEGAVMRAGDQVRISAKVVEVAADRLIWSGSFDRVISDVLALQSDVAGAVVEAVKVRVTPQEESRLKAAAATDPEAYECFLRAREMEATYSSESILEAIRQYQRAVSIEPRFAPAHAGIAGSYLKLSSMYLDPAEAMPRAESAAGKALAIDSTSAAGLAALAYVKGFYRFDWPAAESGLRRAIELNPSDVLARGTYGYLLTVVGRFEESSREFRRAREIDPLSQAYAHHSLMPLYEGRRYDDAIREATAILGADPKAAFVRMIRGQAYSMKGDQEAAIRDLEAAVATERQPHILAYLGLVLAKAGRRAAADSVFREFEALAKSAYAQPYTHAVVSLAKGDRSGALDWLEKGVDRRTEEVVFLKVDPAMDPLRNDPRYQALLRRVGFGA